MAQNGEDDGGILGFLPIDIKKEEERGDKLKCCYCHHAGATIRCCMRACNNRKFHYPCGIHYGSQHFFYRQFKWYCSAYRREQNIPPSVIKLTEKPICIICYDVTDAKPLLTNVWSSCCNTWLHRTCVQKMAYSFGYFFRCPNCCNKKEMFRKEMRKCEIYIPDQDAAWELEPGAFRDLVERKSSCDAENCVCPNGRNFLEERDDWKFRLCRYCGSFAIHTKCKKILQNLSKHWICGVCAPG